LRLSRGGGCATLPNETEEVRECLRRAEECARQAKAQFDTKFRQAFLDLEQRWLRLARSYELSERLDIAADSLEPRQLTARC
jgi:hypothetical protein